MPFAGNSKLGHDFRLPRVGFGASNCSLVEIIFVGDSWTSLAITGTYSYTENKLAHFHIWKLSLHFSMITMTGLKTSKLEKGFSLHAKEIGPGPGHTVCKRNWSWSRAHCSYLDIYISQNIRLCKDEFEGQF